MRGYGLVCITANRAQPACTLVGKLPITISITRSGWRDKSARGERAGLPRPAANFETVI